VRRVYIMKSREQNLEENHREVEKQKIFGMLKASRETAMEIIMT